MAAKQVPPKVPPIERVQASFKELSLAAKDLNTASDELGKAVSILNAALKKLNIGVFAWVQLSGNTDPNTLDWWSRAVGYAKVGDTWGIALRNSRGNYNFPEEDFEETWLFNEGPRWMRTEAVGKIPDLLEELLKQARDTTKKIKDKTTQAYELAVAMSKIAEEGGADACPA